VAHFEKPRRSWLLLCLCFVLAFAGAATSVQAAKNPEKQAQKQQKKAAKQNSNVQELQKRDITHEQLLGMQEAYAETVVAERDGMTETALRRIEREYKAHLESGAPFVRDILIVSGGGAKGAFGAGFMQGWETVTGETALPESTW